MTVHSLNDGAAAPRMCPLSLRSVEGSVLSNEGPTVSAVPCLGSACMAFTTIADDQGRPIGGNCLLCMTPQLLNVIASILGSKGGNNG